MNPGRTNQEDRENFIKFWAEQVSSLGDKEWSRQQNELIDSQIKTAEHKIYLKINNFRALTI